jgi:hypothetical protein
MSIIGNVIATSLRSNCVLAVATKSPESLAALLEPFLGGVPHVACLTLLFLASSIVVHSLTPLPPAIFRVAKVLIAYLAK